ncbi:MAG: helix-turn-helix transcriptional regulator [Roseburia sp.]
MRRVVRAAREEAHLSQAALAEQIGCDERTIPNIENDRGNPKFEVLLPDHCLFTHSCRPYFPP